MTDPTPKRPSCAICLRPQSTCICRWIAPVHGQVELLILQHRLEVANAKNSARLLHLSLPGSVLLAGEAFDQSELQAILSAGGRTPLLLYPGTPADAGLAPAPRFEPEQLPPPDKLRLVVLDATWRKSRKMLYLNLLLQHLPRVALRDMPPSAYRIRKAHAPDQLSTLEASVYALMQLEGSVERYQKLLEAFDGFVSQQESYATRLN
jgi:DTW domain-containing protein YfiP